MKVLGISGSPRAGGTTDRLVQTVLDGCEGDKEFLSLAGKRIGPCMACLGCVGDDVCTVGDDLPDLRERVVAADAYVVGGPNYLGRLNGLTQCFLERLYQFRHREGGALAGKLGVAVGVGGWDPKPAVEQIQTYFEYHHIECVGWVTAQGPVPCFECGHGETCKVADIHMFFGPGTEFTPEIAPDLSKQPDALEHARSLGKRLSHCLSRLTGGT